jgi:hypothetical protein
VGDGLLCERGVPVASQGRTQQNPRGRYWAWPAVLGLSYYVTIETNVAAAAAKELGVAVAEGEDTVAVRTWISATYDRDRVFSVMELRHARVHPAVATAEVDATAELQLMTFNVWNTNPPNWLMRGKEERFAKYSERMDLLCDVIKQTNPPIVAFQEVR